MDDLIDSQQQKLNSGKVYKRYAIILGSFLGGPLVAGYLFANNFNLFGETEKAKKAWIISIITTISVLAIALFIPENINIPNQVIPIAYTAVASYLFKSHLEIKTKQFIDGGGKTYHWLRVVGVGLVGLIITLSAIFAYVITDESIQEQNIGSKTYGTSVLHTIEFDKTNITDREIDLIADGLIAIEFFDETSETYIYIHKEGMTYELLISVIEGTENNKEAIIYYTKLRDLMDDYLPKNNITVKLIVDYIDNVVIVIN